MRKKSLGYDSFNATNALEQMNRSLEEDIYVI